MDIVIRAAVAFAFILLLLPLFSQICQAETLYERLKTKPKELGVAVDRALTIGATTVEAIRLLLQDGREAPAPIKACPWCATPTRN